MSFMPFVEIGAAMWLCLLTSFAERAEHWVDMLIFRVAPMAFAAAIIADALVRLGAVQ